MMPRALLIATLVAVLSASPITAWAGGWYLMYPPVVWPGGVMKVVADAPLSSWRQAGAHESALTCEAERARRKIEADAGLRKQKVDPLAPASLSVMLEMESGGQCVATDDPRLRPPSSVLVSVAAVFRA